MMQVTEERGGEGQREGMQWEGMQWSMIQSQNWRDLVSTGLGERREQSDR